MYVFMYVCINARVYISVCFVHSIYSLCPRLMHMYVPDKYQALGTTKQSPCLKKIPKGDYSSNG
jgi:hypothetical protein